MRNIWFKQLINFWIDTSNFDEVKCYEMTCHRAVPWCAEWNPHDLQSIIKCVFTEEKQRQQDILTLLGLSSFRTSLWLEGRVTLLFCHFVVDGIWMVVILNVVWSKFTCKKEKISYFTIMLSSCCCDANVYADSS